jgi:hypothetical protein
VRKNGDTTAWADKHPVYDLVNGPSGTAVLDLYTPEIDSNKTGTNKTWTSDAKFTQEYDKLHVDAALNWIKGMDHTGQRAQPVPRLFGFNMQVCLTLLLVVDLDAVDVVVLVIQYCGVLCQGSARLQCTLQQPRYTTQ